MFPKEEHPRALQGFEILERLGAGGVGQVFLARSKAGRLVAIKVLSDNQTRDDAFSEQLAREASLCSRLHHPAIVQVRAFVEEAGFAALVFEYVEGVALGRLLRFCATHGVRLPDRAAWHIVERVLAGLAYAHAQHDEQKKEAPIVHRDVSPSNVLVDWGGGVKLADFGMATMLGVSPATRLGLVKGTLGCMAPEQARGERVTERADVYAAALLAWRLATGRTPFAKFKKDEIELLRAMRSPKLRPLSALRPDLPEPLLTAVARALEPDDEKRTITAEEFRAVVRANVDVAAGHLELAELLTRWRSALVKSVTREREDLSSDAGPAEPHTSRYEEVALAFTDEGLIDGPTAEEYSLPSDAAILATLPIDGEVTVSMPERRKSSAPPPKASLEPRPPSTPPAAPRGDTAEAAPAHAVSIVEQVEPALDLDGERRSSSVFAPPMSPALGRGVVAALVAIAALVCVWLALH